MSHLPTISIVTPTLNQRKFLKTTIQSVLDQDYPYLEYMVMDGGSKNGTQELLASYGEQLQWISQLDKGQSVAINQGWKSSHGEIIAWLNSDDLYLPGALYYMGNYFRKNPDVDIIYGDADYIDGNGQMIEAYPTQPFDLVELVSNAINYIPQPAVFIRRRVMERIGFLDESLSFTMDFDYWLRAGLEHTIVYLPHKLAQLRLHSEAKSLAYLGEFAQELVIMYFNYFNNRDLPPALKSIETQAMANIYIRAADCAYWVADIPTAQAFLQQSQKYRPLRPTLLRWLVRLGKPGHKLATKLFGNPYYKI